MERVIKNLKNRSGVTLLEVLLAVVIFSIVSVSIMSIIGNVNRMRIRNKIRYHATVIASNEAELLKYSGRTKNLNDSIYTVNVSGSEYDIERIKLDKQEEMDNLHPVEIRVLKNGEIVKTFRMLQGIKKDDHL